MLQQDEQDGEVAVARCIHERGVAAAVLQVDARAPLQHSSLTIASWSLDAAACSRAKAKGLPTAAVAEQCASTSPPVRSHLTTFVSSPSAADSKISRCSKAGVLSRLSLESWVWVEDLARLQVDLFGKRDGRAHRRSGSLGAAGATDSGGPTCERAAPP